MTLFEDQGQVGTAKRGGSEGKGKGEALGRKEVLKGGGRRVKSVRHTVCRHEENFFDPLRIQMWCGSVYDGVSTVRRIIVRCIGIMS